MSAAWITNDPAAAKQLRAIDRAYERSRAKASSWSLKEKVDWYAKCRATRDAAYARVHGRLQADGGRDV